MPARDQDRGRRDFGQQAPDPGLSDDGLDHAQSAKPEIGAQSICQTMAKQSQAHQGAPRPREA